ncbi:2-succinyl-6-hydroxy-2,4-cyclohexadiene-1-carboxylate synthase [Pantoea sp. FN060301]|uniref:2-succinyl-6-hydroxy-2, 4-cyclohexadiene-1-carboxylate synthase n=1 Tax=Pantoea sp. FN060301 TaxID=3420380 RepID=UPI003D174647
MRLHARWQRGQESSRPALVWLHGFLGSGDEWRAIQPHFSEWPQLSLDLPGHGGSSASRVEGFEALSGAIVRTLHRYQIQRYWLIGYSLGGRVALSHACQPDRDGLSGVIVEGAHPGLSCESERRERGESDARWARLFRQQPLLKTLDRWYRQPVFNDLSEDERQETIALRRQNHPDALAAMLLATSLSRQPDLTAALRQLRLPVHAICGERDAKFLHLTQRAALPCHVIPRAGHNAHRANPQAFAAQLRQILTQCKDFP